MTDKVLETLYSLYYNELIRYKLTPTYVEHRILLELLGSIKNYIMGFVNKLKKTIENETKKNTESYLTWDKKYYEDSLNKKLELLEEFKTKLENTKSETFLSIDFSVTNSNLDNLYPSFLPKSNHREVYSKLWTGIKGKHD